MVRVVFLKAVAVDGPDSEGSVIDRHTSRRSCVPIHFDSTHLLNVLSGLSQPRDMIIRHQPLARH